VKPRVALNYAGNVLYYALLGAKRTKCVHVYSLYRAMLARTVLSQVVRPSVCSCVTRRHCVKTAKHVIKLFTPSGSHVFRTKPYGNISTGTH